MSDETNIKIVRAEKSYPTTYVYKLWVACLDDMDALDLKDRAYCSHILRKFSYWKEQKKEKTQYEFQNAHGGDAWVDQLTYNHIYSFTHQRNDRKSGPGPLKPELCAVLDMYFKVECPEIALSFKSDEEYDAVARINSIFFAGPRDNYMPSDHWVNISGIYVVSEKDYVARLRECLIEEVPGGSLRIEVFFIDPPTHGNFTRIRKTLIEPQERFFIKNAYLSNYFQYVKSMYKFRLGSNNFDETAVYQGLAFPSETHEFRDRTTILQAACLLRHQITHEPTVANFNFLHNRNDPYYLSWSSKHDVEHSVLYNFSGHELISENRRFVDVEKIKYHRKIQKINKKYNKLWQKENLYSNELLNYLKTLYDKMRNYA